MADVLHVSTYLVGAARLQTTFHQCGVTKAFQHFPVGDGRLADFRVGRKHLHTLSVTWVASYVSLDASLIAHHVAPYQGVVGAVSVVVEELLA